VNAVADWLGLPYAVLISIDRVALRHSTPDRGTHEDNITDRHRGRRGHHVVYDGIWDTQTRRNWPEAKRTGLPT
jgi:hypothetical protein